MIRGIIFDCFGVLYGPSAFALKNLCSPERVRELDDVIKRLDYGYISSDEYSSAVADIVGRPAAEIAQLINKKRHRNDKMIEFAHRLKRQDKKIALLSNIGVGILDELLNKAERTALFDVEILSSDVGLTKPDTRIYQLTVERLGLPAAECVMIDDQKVNCDGAKVAGLLSIHHVSNHQTIKRYYELAAS